MYSELEKVVGTVRYDEPIANYTYTKVGGKADVFVLPISIDEIRSVLTFAKSNNIPVTILGNGSNVVIRDGGIRGIVMSLIKLVSISASSDNKVTVQSGVTMQDLAIFLEENELKGFEFASGIPGTMGGAIYMNAGAYEGEISEVFHSLTYMSFDGEIDTLKNEDMAFKYRYTILQEMKAVVLDVTLQLQQGVRKEIRQLVEELTVKRQSSQPLELPSCGSVYKRPKRHFTGPLVIKAGLQGYRIGGIEVSTKHAGFVVNLGNGTASDYEALINLVKARVYEDSGVLLDVEVRIIGDFEDY